MNINGEVKMVLRKREEERERESEGTVSKFNAFAYF